jgi:DNA-directed RNA polymerase specialized sigma subunit
MRLRFGLGGEPPLSRSEIASVLGISSVAVFTTEKRALERLRDLALEEGFMNYLNDSFWLK